MSASPKAVQNVETSRDDQVLVSGCLRGGADAWAALIDKYKNLIYSIPIKQGFSPDDAADVFQAVCLALVAELPRLREPRALASWLIQTTSHKCLRTRTEGQRYVPTEFQEEKLSDLSEKAPDELMRELECEQMMRDAVAELPVECKRMVELLFYQAPPLSYDDVAASLGIPKGSIGPTRMRCLEKLKRLLEKNGF